MTNHTSSEPGAPPEKGTIPLCVPHLDGNEAKYLQDCVETNWVSSAGGYVDRFERGLAERVGREHSVATSSGTAALHLALRCLGIGPGDAVLVNTLTFIAPANAVRYVGAEPVFVDADSDTYQMDVDDLRHLIEDRFEEREGELHDPVTGRRVSAILPVHILGHPCRMDPILELADEHDLYVVEDASESLGSRYKGKPVGSLGDVAVFSFNGNKIITSGGGGMLVTDDGEVAERAKYLSTQAKDDPIEYVHEEIGYNYRMTNIEAAVGFAQLEQLDLHLDRKREIARRYDEALGRLTGIETMPRASWAEVVPWLYTPRLRGDTPRESLQRMKDCLRERGVETRPLWQPMHRSPAHRSTRSLQTAEDICRSALCLPSSVGLGAESQEKVVREVTSVLQGR